MRTRVKICGVTNVDDALAAARAGADAVGIIQVPSAKRCVDLGTACDIARALPSFVTPVLVFADATPDVIQTIAARTGVRTVQLHGHERVETALALHNLNVIKRLEVGLSLKAELDHWSLLDRTSVGAILLEGPGRTGNATPSTGGGTGTPSDWDSIEWTLAQFAPDALPPLVLAGGLTPETVARIVRRFRPFAVDTSSGVENPAIALRKDVRRVQAFVEAVQSAGRQTEEAAEIS